MPESAVLPAVGLLVVDGQQPVPLLGVDVHAELSIVGARVTMTQRYVNREAAAIEAVYVFPLDEGAAVCGFTAVVDDVRFVGEVLERDKAFERYDDAMLRGDGAFLLDEERPDIFIASIGNLPPGKAATIEIAYISELRVTDGEFRFVLPSTVAPRYAPPSDRVGVGAADAQTLNPPIALDVPYGLTLRVNVALPGGVRRIECPSHPVSIAFDGAQAEVTLAQTSAALDRDFVLSLCAPSFDEPLTCIEQEEDGRTTVAISVVPRFESHREASDVVLLVDRSGSMKGPSIEQVRNALQLCLRALEPGSCFNIYGFGTHYSRLFPASRPYDDETLRLASEYVDRIDADMGGTEMLPALRAALESARCGQLPRQVLLLTDGEVTNTDEVIALAGSHAARARIFTIGIGSSVSHHLLKGVARAGQGSAEFIHAGERIEPKIVRLFDRLLSPSLADVRVDWGGMRVTQVPHDLTTIFSGERLILYGLEAQLRATAVHIAARRGDADVSFTAPIDPATSVAGRMIGALAARARIRELEEHPDWARGSRQARCGDPATREIVALSTRYRVISRATSFVALERRDTPVESDVQLRRVPIRLADGWGGHRTATFPQLQLRVGASGPATLAAFRASPPPLASPPPAEYSGEPSTIYDMFSSFGPPAHKRNFTGAVMADGVRRGHMHRVLKLQRADGTWDLTNELAHHAGIHIRQLEDAMPSSSLPPADARVVWATAIAISWCQRYAPHLRPEWGAAARKGQDKLQEFLAGGADTWIDAALALYAVVHLKWNEGLKELQD